MHKQIDEGRLESIADSKANEYLKKYQGYVNILESQSPLSQVRSINAYDIYALGKQLDAFESYRDICEEDGTLSALGKIPDVAFN